MRRFPAVASRGVAALLTAVIVSATLTACDTSDTAKQDTFVKPTGPGYGESGSDIGAGLKTPEGALRVGPVFPGDNGSSRAFLLLTGDPLRVMRSLVEQTTGAGFTPYVDKDQVTTGRPINYSDKNVPLCAIDKSLDTPDHRTLLTDEAATRRAKGRVLTCGMTAVKPNQQPGMEEEITVRLQLGRDHGTTVSRLEVSHYPTEKSLVEDKALRESSLYQEASYVPTERSPIQPHKLDLPRAGEKLGPHLPSGGPSRVAAHSQLMAPLQLDNTINPTSLTAVVRVDTPANADTVFTTYARQVYKAVDAAMLVPRETADINPGGDNDIYRVTHTVSNDTEIRSVDFTDYALTLVVDPHLGAYLLLDRQVRE